MRSYLIFLLLINFLVVIVNSMIIIFGTPTFIAGIALTLGFIAFVVCCFELYND